MMDYSQNSVGNCCGAWCVTRYLCLASKPDWDRDDTIFKKEGRKIWNDVKFIKGEGAPPDWVNNNYSDPWKMIDKLGGISELQIELAASNTSIKAHQGLLKILKSLTSKKGKTIGSMSICGLPKGGYAIPVMHDGSGLHYLLVTRPGTDSDLEIYDPRDKHLGWTTHKTFSYWGTVTTKTSSLAEQKYKFLGVFIAIK